NEGRGQQLLRRSPSSRSRPRRLAEEGAEEVGNGPQNLHEAAALDRGKFLGAQGAERRGVVRMSLHGPFSFHVASVVGYPATGERRARGQGCQVRSDQFACRPCAARLLVPVAPRGWVGSGRADIMFPRACHGTGLGSAARSPLTSAMSAASSRSKRSTICLTVRVGSGESWRAIRCDSLARLLVGRRS